MGVSRLEFFRRLGVIRLVEPILDAQYRRDEDANWRGELQMSSREIGWNSSFHASQFPGDDPMACGRRALYRLMGIPSEAPFTPESRALMESGLDIEDRVVGRFKRAGILLSKDDGQTNFVAKKYWLTGHVDAIIRPPSYRAPHPVEVKTTSDQKVEEMRAGTRQYVPEHRYQLMTYIWFTRQAHKALGYDSMGMEPARDGSIIYLSRDRPRNTFEFYVDFDQNVINVGLTKIVQWQRSFLDEELPPRNSTWKWTERPCRWCDFKGMCKQDVKEKVTSLARSNAIIHARYVKPDYDYHEVRIATLTRWAKRNGADG
jgi:hypothetical protein